MLCSVAFSQGFLLLYARYEGYISSAKNRNYTANGCNCSSRRPPCNAARLSRAGWSEWLPQIPGVQKIRECDGVCSFYLAPHDGKPLPPYKPGNTSRSS